ncbi:MAG: FAD-binding protein, partial [Erysipelotrichaceae bacterium]|nr:FAD-binding protein [Erysipelotrichaceae bacterium]
MEKLAKELQQYGQVQENVSLRTMTTLRIGGNARIVVYPKNILALTQVLREIKEVNAPYRVIGKGSNLLCSDDDFNGVVIRLDRTFTEHYFDHDICYAEAGCSIIALAYDAMKNSLSGLEFASGIPGTVGGVTFMNAGAYKSNMAAIIQEVFVYHDGQLSWMDVQECEFDYRTSIFQKHRDWIV